MKPDAVEQECHRGRFGLLAKPDAAWQGDLSGGTPPFIINLVIGESPLCTFGSFLAD